VRLAPMSNYRLERLVIDKVLTVVTLRLCAVFTRAAQAHR